MVWSLVRRVGLIGALVFGLGSTLAHAAGPTPQQIQALIAGGHARTALADLRPIVRAHPESGVAWYLTAEARDALGQRAEARAALARAEAVAPGLPFAQPDKVAALKAHLAGADAGTGASMPVAASGFHFSPWMLVIGALIVLFIIMRIRRRAAMRGMGNPFGGSPIGQGMQPPYGPAGGAPYGSASYGTGTGSGIGGALASGLALGVGVAAGERIIDGLTGGERGRGLDGTPPPDQAADPAADRDDGLLGSPGWDDNDNSGDDSSNDFDPDNNW